MGSWICCECNNCFYEELNSSVDGLVTINGREYFICDSCMKRNDLEKEDIRGFIVARLGLRKSCSCSVCEKLISNERLPAAAQTLIDGRTLYVCDDCLKENDLQPSEIRGFIKAKMKYSSPKEQSLSVVKQQYSNNHNQNHSHSETAHKTQEKVETPKEESTSTPYRYRDNVSYRPQNTTITVDSNSMLKTIEASKSYTGKAFLTFICYYIGFFIVGFIMNLVYLSDAKKTTEIIGVSPPGRGCLQFLLVVHIILPIFLILLLTGVITLGTLSW